MSKKEQKPIEYEQVTIKVPKQIMTFLRSQAMLDNFSLEEEIEYRLLDDVRASMEAMSGEDLINSLNVGPIFYDVLGDERYKPVEPKLKTEN